MPRDFGVLSIWRKNTQIGIGKRQRNPAQGKTVTPFSFFQSLTINSRVLSALPSLFSSSESGREVRSNSLTPLQSRGPRTPACLGGLFGWPCIFINPFKGCNPSSRPGSAAEVSAAEAPGKSQLKQHFPLHHHLSLIHLRGSLLKIKQQRCCSTHPTGHCAFCHLVWQSSA